MTPLKPLFASPLPPPRSRNRPQEGGFSAEPLSVPVPPASSHFAEIARHFAAMPIPAAHWKIDWFATNAGICPAYRSLPCLN
jgi:hypothetical protein